MNYQELISDRRKKSPEKICAACGEKFSPIDHNGVVSSRKYCTRLACERKREKEKRERVKRARSAQSATSHPPKKP